MAYHSHFSLADDMITHLDTIVGGTTDPFISSRYVGFVAVSAVTVYELAIKEIFITFAGKKNPVFGEFAKSHFDRINGRIKHSHLKDDYIVKFGRKYLSRYKKKVDVIEKHYLRTHSVSVINSYNNLIIWRNDFAHEGRIPTTVTYPEVVEAFRYGKEIIKCLAESMVR